MQGLKRYGINENVLFGMDWRYGVWVGQDKGRPHSVVFIPHEQVPAQSKYNQVQPPPFFLDPPTPER